MMAVIRLKTLPHFEGLQLPSYESGGAAGFDLRAAVGEDMFLAAGARAAIPTGLIFEIPRGHEVQVRPRSGLALKHGITCLNSPGTVDADYRGEVMIILANMGKDNFTIQRGMRIAQGVLAPVVQARFESVEDVGSTPRGAAGFGSTGTN
ncbi:MAG: dUTP diphosphatase [Pseudomonadota bacterium]